MILGFGLNTVMTPDDPLESELRELIIDVCEAMMKHGFDSVSIGAVMRLIGVDESRAKQHDYEFFALDQDFHKILKKRKTTVLPPLACSATLH